MSTKVFDTKRIAALKEKYEKAGYARKVWTINEDSIVTLEQFAEYLYPAYKDVTEAVVIEKEFTDKNGKKKTFLKVNLIFSGGTEIEWDLPYNDKDEDIIDFEEGDVFDLSTLRFCEETCMGESHKYAIGKIME